MRVSRVTPEIRKIVKKEQRRNPLFGCRKLSGVLKAKYSLNISKSLVNTILSEGKAKQKAGVKSAQKQAITDHFDKCGLSMIKAAELELCIPDIVNESLGIAFPWLKAERLSGLLDFIIAFFVAGGGRGNCRESRSCCRREYCQDLADHARWRFNYQGVGHPR